MVYNFELVCGRGGLEALSFLINIPLYLGNLLLPLRLDPMRVLGVVVEGKLTFRKVW